MVKVAYCIYDTVGEGFLGDTELEFDLHYAMLFGTRQEAEDEGRQAYFQIGEDWEDLKASKRIMVLPVKVTIPEI